jgi:cell division protein FtsW (lipid II flippase)
LYFFFVFFVFCFSIFFHFCEDSFLNFLIYLFLLFLFFEIITITKRKVVYGKNTWFSPSFSAHTPPRHLTCYHGR